MKRLWQQSNMMLDETFLAPGWDLFHKRLSVTKMALSGRLLQAQCSMKRSWQQSNIMLDETFLHQDGTSFTKDCP